MTLSCIADNIYKGYLRGISLTHCGLVMPYGEKDLSGHWPS